MTTLLCSAAAVHGQAPVVAIDVGHGHKAPGAISARGVGEFDFNRRLSGRLATALEMRRVSVRPVNFAGDVDELAERPRLAGGSDFFLSVHHDSVGEAFLKTWQWNGEALTYTDDKRGFGIFVSRWNPLPDESLRCASAMGASLRLAGFHPSDWHGRKHEAADAENGVWYYDNLVVLYRTVLPAALLEAGVIKHRDEELQLADPAQQERMADAVALGLAACLSVRGKPAPE